MDQSPAGKAATAAATAAAASEKILKMKIEELEAGHEHLKQEMSKLIISGAASDLKLFQYKADNPQHLNNHNRSVSISPQRSRFNIPPRRSIAVPAGGGGGGGFDGSSGSGGGGGSGKNSPSSNRQPSPLHRVCSNPEPKIDALITIDELELDRVLLIDTTVGDCGGAAALNFTDKQYLNILHRMGKSVHIFDLDGSIIYWNHTAEKTYGYQASEVIGRDVTELLADDKDHDALNEIIQRVRMGESWSGQFPIQTKTGERFAVKVTKIPFYDDYGTLVGVICVSNDSLEFQDMKAPLPGLNLSRDTSLSKLKNTLGLDPKHPLTAVITSKISDLASLVNLKVNNQVRLQRTGDNSAQGESGSGDSLQSGYLDVLPSNQSEDVVSSAISTPRGDIPQSPFSMNSQGLVKEKSLGLRDSGYESEGSLGAEKSITSKAEEWIASKGMSWPWKGGDRDRSLPKSKKFAWPWLNNDEDKKSDFSDANSKTQTVEVNQPSINEVTGSWFSSCNVHSTGSVSSCESTSSASNKVDCESDNSDCDILWEDLTVGEQIGQGSCGTVYHALWYGSDVAVKVFSRQEYSDDVIFSFKEEVSLMKRLRHPNVLLFMGVVTSHERLCIVTELLPRGSLFRLLQRNATKLDMKRRVQMAIDIARGMNYLHRYNPPIIHRDLKSSNLMVDKNWTVKVGDFGLSRLKHGTYLSTSTGKGTPQWMAPEVLRNEPSNEKCDIYSYGVVLWEIVTEKVPWESLNQMQVIGAVGFVNQRLEIPKDVDPQWTAIILSCWQSEPQLRPTFQELLDKFKDLQRHYAVKAQAPRATATDSNNLKEV